MSPIHDISTYVHEHIVLPPYYIQNLLIREGSMLIYGGAGVRKSWLVQHLCYSMSAGIPWLGMRTEQARTLLVNFEISPPAFAIYRLRPMERLFTLQTGMSLAYSPDEDNIQVYLEDDESATRFLEIVRPFAPNIIALDCLQGCYAGDENNMEQAGRWIRNVKRIQTELHCSIIIVHHSNKSQFATGMGKMRGTTRFSAWVDSVVCMVEQPTGIQLQFEKYRLSSVPVIPNLNIRFENFMWTVL